MNALVPGRTFSTWKVLLCTIAFCALALSPTLLWNFAYDQGTFAYGGTAILHGARPYLDFWDIKPPSIFYTYAVAFSLFGQSVFAIRFDAYLNALLTIGLLGYFVERAFRGWDGRHLAACCASVAFVLQFYVMGPWNTAQVEDYSLPWILGAAIVLLPVTGERLRWRAMLSGVLLSVATFYKFPNGLFVLPICALLVRCPDGRRVVKWFFGGYVLGSALHVLALAMTGELLPLWHITTTATASYVEHNYSGSFTMWQNLRTGIETSGMLWVGAGLVGWLVLLLRRRDEDSAPLLPQLWLIVLTIVTAFAIVQSQNKGYTYHYWVLMPWMDVLVGVGIVVVVAWVAKIIRLPRGVVGVGVLALLTIGSYALGASSTLHKRATAFSDVLYRRVAPNGYIGGDGLVNYVERVTRPGDSIFIFGFEPYVYWKTGRPPATRFLNTIHFKSQSAAPAERAELVGTLLAHPPRLMLVATEDRYTSQGNSDLDSRTTIARDFPKLEQLLDTRYTVNDTVQSVIGYLLNR